jgi:hypothetical protein
MRARAHAVHLHLYLPFSNRTKVPPSRITEQRRAISSGNHLFHLVQTAQAMPSYRRILHPKTHSPSNDCF